MNSNKKDDPAQRWTKVSQSEMDEIIRLHELYLDRKTGGRRALLAFHDISGLKLSNRDLSEADFSGARMRRVKMNATKLKMTNFFGADLRMADLKAATLNRADLRGACLRGADLSDAYLAGANLCGVEYTLHTTWPEGFDPVAAEAVLTEGREAA